MKTFRIVKKDGSELKVKGVSLAVTELGYCVIGNDNAIVFAAPHSEVASAFEDDAIEEIKAKTDSRVG